MNSGKWLDASLLSFDGNTVLGHKDLKLKVRHNTWNHHGLADSSWRFHGRWLYATRKSEDLDLDPENIDLASLDASLQDLYRFPTGSSGQEVVKDAGLSHHVAESSFVRQNEILLKHYHSQTKRELTSCFKSLPGWVGQQLGRVAAAGPGVEHGGTEDGGEVVQGHLVLPVQAGHPHQVLDHEDNAGLARVLRQLREEMEVGSRSLGFVLDRVSFEKLRIRFAGEYTLWQIPAVNIMSYL